MKLAECHPTRKAKGRGLCGPYYEKLLKSENPEYHQRQLKNSREWKSRNREEYLAKERKRGRERWKDPKYRAQKRSSWLKSRYGITLQDYEQTLTEQGGGCALCGRKPGKIALHVDHDHTTGRVRGLLCHQCNWYMGTVDKDPSLIERIASYHGETEN
jgi:hypothetical protein